MVGEVERFGRWTLVGGMHGGLFIMGVCSVEGWIAITIWVGKTAMDRFVSCAKTLLENCEMVMEYVLRLTVLVEVVGGVTITAGISRYTTHGRTTGWITLELPRVVTLGGS